MSYKIDPKNIKDPLADLFREKLGNHEVPVDNGDWNEIKKQLGGNKKLRLWTVFSAISAAVVALLFILSPSEQSPLDDHPLQGESTKTVASDQNDKLITDNISPSQKQEVTTEATLDNDKFVATGRAGDVKQKSEKTYPASVEDKFVVSEPEQPLVEDTPVKGTEQEVEYLAEVNTQLNKTNVVTVAESESKQETVKEQPIQPLDLFNFEDEQPKKKEKRNWTLAATYGGSVVGNGNESDVQVSALMQTSTSSPNAGNVVDQPAMPSKYGEGKYFPEMSVSFTVGKQIGKRLAIESGVTYTYLYTKYDGVEQFSNLELKQHLHYIGIPVNVRVDVFDGSSKWNLYASGGAMIEKGIRAVYKETEDKVMVEGEVLNLNRSESISGVQFSVNASVGVSYDLSKNFSLFLAPRISYYFDNDQPKSIRTDKDVSFGVNLGLKYNL